MESKKRKVTMQNENTYDLAFWLSKTPSERIAEVTRLIQKDLKPRQRMDKTKFAQIKLKDK